MDAKLFTVSAAIAVLVAATHGQEAAQSTDVRGRVVNSLTRAPVRNAVVTVKVPIAEGDYRTREIGFLTGEDGRFLFANIDIRTTTIRASKAGWMREDERDAISAAA